MNDPLHIDYRLTWLALLSRIMTIRLLQPLFTQFRCRRIKPCANKKLINETGLLQILYKCSRLVMYILATNNNKNNNGKITVIDCLKFDQIWNLYPVQRRALPLTDDKITDAGDEKCNKFLERNHTNVTYSYFCVNYSDCGNALRINVGAGPELTWTANRPVHASRVQRRPIGLGTNTRLTLVSRQSSTGQ